MGSLHVGVRSTEEFNEQLQAILDARAASRISAQDPSLWGSSAAEEASKRLGWVDLPVTSVPLVEQIEELREALAGEGIDRIVLAGMGGSSLGAEVITETAGVALTILDTTNPDEVRAAFGDDVSRTALIVASKSGTTVETDSHRAIFEALCEAQGINAAAHLIAVTDPETKLHARAEAEGYRAVFLGDPHVGGRFAVLSAFGLVPAGLAGAPIAQVLAEASQVAEALAQDSADNPAVQLGAFLGTAHGLGTEKLVIATTDSPIVGLGAWLEQLIAESTGKEGLGILPVVVDSVDAPGFADARPDAALLFLGSAVGDHQPLSQFAAALDYPLGAQFLLWEYATSIAGYSIGINPFDQPDVEAAKKNARALLSSETQGFEKGDVDGAVEIIDPAGLVRGDVTLRSALHAVVDASDEYGYIAFQAYVDRGTAGSAEALRAVTAQATGLQTTFGFGPRYLHSTGQYHKGGHPNGSFIQLLGPVAHDVEVPHAGYTLGTLQEAQAAGDAEALRERPLITLRLLDVDQGLAAITDDLRSLTRD